MKYLKNILAAISFFQLQIAIAQPPTPSNNNLGYHLPSLIDTVISGAVQNGMTLSTAFNSSISKFNFNRIWTPIVSVTDEAQLNLTGYPVNINSKMVTKYFDGFGKPLENITRLGGAGKDIISYSDNRPSVNKVQFLPYSVSPNSGFVYDPFGEQKNYYNLHFPDEGFTSFTEDIYSPDHSTYSYEPGKSTVGQYRGTQSYTDINGENEVIVWGVNYTDYLPQQNGYYQPGDLMKQVTINFDGGHVEIFTDREGKKICEKELAYNGCDNNSCASYNTTYYVYDEIGRLIFTLPPLATASILSNSGSLSSVVNNLCFYVKFDGYGRATQKHSPGQNGDEYLIYNSKNRIILNQTPLLKKENKWLFYLYDNDGRVATIGLYKTTKSYSDLLSDVNNTSLYSSYMNPDNFYYYLLLEQDKYIPDNTNNGYQSIVINYYDYYVPSYTFSPQFDFNQYNGYFTPTGNALLPEVTQNVFGKLTRKKVRVLYDVDHSYSTGQLSYWVQDVYFYDNRGNLIQTHSQNAQGGVDITSVQYNYSNQPIVTVVNQNNPQCSTKPYTKYGTYYTYGKPNGELISVRQKIDDGSWVPISNYSYDEFGKVKTKHIGGIETQNYRYNIRGQLTGINQGYAETGNKNGADITFGESIRYDAGTSDPLYNGNISAIMWRGSSGTRLSSYGYAYDPSGRLLSANYNELQPGCPICWNKGSNDFSVPIINYDEGGNIKHMQQWGWGVDNSGNQYKTAVDDLTYHYLPNSNTLANVTDASNYNGVNDYVDRHMSDQYDYDEEGNLKMDLNKNITSIKYNFLDLPEIITVNNNGTTQTIKYFYDAAKNKVKEEVDDGTSTTYYDYNGNMRYKNGDPYLISTPEGRARYHKNSQNAWVWDYDFFVKDHLGNVRTVLNAQDVPAQDYFATHEVASAHLENLLFDNIPSVQDPKPGSLSPDDLKAARLNALEPSRRVGTSILLNVSAGDKFELSSDAYCDPTSYDWQIDNQNAIPMSQIMNGLINTLTTGVGGINPGEGSSSANQAIIHNLISTDNFLNTFSAIQASSTDAQQPKAYLNYLLFDDKMNLLPEQSGAVQINASGQWTNINIGSQVMISQNGFLLIYIGNQSPFDVYFDNIHLRFYKGQLLEETHYYPYGLAINDATISPLVDKQSLYQSNECNTEFGINLSDFHNRNYDAELGRFAGIDPKRADLNGYVAMANNPVSNIDPNGENPFVVAGAIGGLTGLITGLIRGDRGLALVQDIALDMSIGLMTAGMGAVLEPEAGTIEQFFYQPGFAKGMGNGALIGMFSGFTGSLGSDIIHHTGNPLKDGLAGAITGGITGGLIGGVAAGMKSVRYGWDFTDGAPSEVSAFADAQNNAKELTPEEWAHVQQNLSEYMSGKLSFKLDNVEQLQTCNQEGVTRFFPNVESKLVYPWKYMSGLPNDIDFEGWGLSDKGVFINQKGEIAYGLTSGSWHNVAKTGISPWVSKYVGTSDELVFKAIVGHEIIHAYGRLFIYHYIQDISEKAAYQWSHDVFEGANMKGWMSWVTQTARSVHQWGRFDVSYFPDFMRKLQ